MTRAEAGPLPAGVELPDVDVRSRLNERAFRNWTESSRRAIRIAGLVSSDVAAGLLGVMTVQSTWTIVSDGGLRPLPDEVPLLAMVFCLQPLALRVAGAYGSGRARTDIVKISAGVAMAALLGWVQARLFGREVPDLPNKAAYLYSALVITTIAWAFRMVLDRIVAAGYRAGLLKRRVLVVGSRVEVEELSLVCRSARSCDFEVVGRLSTHVELVVPAEEANAGRGVPYAGQVEALEEVLPQMGAQGIVVASNLPFDRMEALASRCFRLGATISILPRALKRLSSAQIEVRHSPAGSLLQLRPVRLDVPQLAIKRTMDLALTLVGLALVWPLFILIALAIKLDSRGPVFFGQMRAGVGGRPFRMLKFRTMRDGADAEKASLAALNESQDSRLFKIRNDPRVTRVGWWLRRASLDELPQLINVVRGEMSLVGPRPLPIYEANRIKGAQRRRLAMRPGITGLWQVAGRNMVDFDEWMRMDLLYVDRWSLALDVRILVRTIPVVLSGTGAS